METAPIYSREGQIKKRSDYFMNKAVKSRKNSRIKGIQMFLMLLPMLVLFFLFCAYPLFDSIYLSFTKYNGFTEPVRSEERV